MALIAYTSFMYKRPTSKNTSTACVLRFLQCINLNFGLLMLKSLLLLLLFFCYFLGTTESKQSPQDSHQPYHNACTKLDNAYGMFKDDIA